MNYGHEKLKQLFTARTTHSIAMTDSCTKVPLIVHTAQLVINKEEFKATITGNDFDWLKNLTRHFVHPNCSIFVSVHMKSNQAEFYLS